MKLLWILMFLASATATACVVAPPTAKAQSAVTATPAPLPPAPPVYSLDGATLGSTVAAYISKRGKPNSQSDSRYVWRNASGGSLTVRTDSDGIITIIDVKAGKKEVRSVDISGRLDRFNDGGHINEPPPLWVPLWSSGGDDCSPGLVGSPCETFLLPRNAELVMNFGGDNGGADWDLTEVIVGQRAALLQSGTVVKHSEKVWPGPRPESRSRDGGTAFVLYLRWTLGRGST